MKPFWRQYLISGLLVSIVAGLIYQKFNSPPTWSVFIMWLPAAWILILGFALMFCLFLNWGEN
ncbi:hypothetical protein ES703_107937 [subsurface metagenome]